MATNSGEVRVPIAVPVDTNAAAASDSIRAFKDTISQSKDSIKEAAAAMRDLRGKSDDVKAAKDQLKAKIREEEAAVTKATLAMLKQGTSLDDVAKKEKAAAEKKASLAEAEKKRADASKKQADEAKKGADAMGRAIATAGGPVAAMKDKLSTMNELLGGTEGGMAAVVGVAALAAAALLAVGAAAVAGAYALGKFIVVSADAARMMQLTRKANLNGNDQWAKNLGDQIDALGRSIPIAKEKLNDLGISLARSRIGGQTMIDTLKAVGGATAAAGDDLGNKLKGIVERGAFTKRFQLSPQELMGMDLDFSDVAKAYASGMHMSVEAARMALFEGRVKLADGAAALKTAVEAKFGQINADKLLGLDNQLVKFKQDLAGLAKNVDLTPILKGIKSLADNFDQTNTNGVAMRHIVETIGKSIGVTFQEGVPMVQNFIDKAVWGALKIENYWLRAKLAFRETFGPKRSLEGALFFGSLEGAMRSMLGVAETIIPGLSTLVAIFDGFKLVSASVDNIKTSVGQLAKAFSDVDWGKTGSAIVNGIIGGLVAGERLLVDKVKGLASSVRKAFTGELEIHSPSRVMYRGGRDVAKGAELGVEDGTPAVHAAAAKMADLPSVSASSGGSGRGGSLVVNLTFAPVIYGGSGDVGAQLREPSLLRALNEQIQLAIRAAGIEVPS